MTYAIVVNGVVVNTIDWDGVSAWQTPSGAVAVRVSDTDYVGIGWTYDGTTFTAPIGTFRLFGV